MYSQFTALTTVYLLYKLKFIMIIWKKSNEDTWSGDSEDNQRFPHFGRVSSHLLVWLWDSNVKVNLPNRQQIEKNW